MQTVMLTLWAVSPPVFSGQAPDPLTVEDWAKALLDATASESEFAGLREIPESPLAVAAHALPTLDLPTIDIAVPDQAGSLAAVAFASLLPAPVPPVGASTPDVAELPLIETAFPQQAGSQEQTAAADIAQHGNQTAPVITNSTRHQPQQTAPALGLTDAGFPLSKLALAAAGSHPSVGAEPAPPLPLPSPLHADGQQQAAPQKRDLAKTPSVLPPDLSPTDHSADVWQPKVMDAASTTGPSAPPPTQTHKGPSPQVAQPLDPKSVAWPLTPLAYAPNHPAPSPQTGSIDMAQSKANPALIMPVATPLPHGPALRTEPIKTAFDIALQNPSPVQPTGQGTSPTPEKPDQPRKPDVQIARSVLRGGSTTLPETAANTSLPPRADPKQTLPPEPQIEPAIDADPVITVQRGLGGAFHIAWAARALAPETEPSFDHQSPPVLPKDPQPIVIPVADAPPHKAVPKQALETDSSPKTQPGAGLPVTQDTPERNEPLPSANSAVAEPNARIELAPFRPSDPLPALPDLAPPAQLLSVQRLPDQPPPVQPPPDQPPPDQLPVVQQATAALAARLTTDPAGQLELTLTPDDLGSLRFDIRTEGDRIAIVLSAERPETMDLIRRHLPDLLAELKQAGVQAGSMSFGAWGDGRQASAQPQPQFDTHKTHILPPPTPHLAPQRPTLTAGGLDLRF